MMAAAIVQITILIALLPLGGDVVPKKRPSLLVKRIPGLKASTFRDGISVLEQLAGVIICTEELWPKPSPDVVGRKLKNTSIDLEVKNCTLKQALDKLCKFVNSTWEIEGNIVNIKGPGVPGPGASPLDFRVGYLEFYGDVHALRDNLRARIPKIDLLPVFAGNNSGDKFLDRKFRLNITKPATVRQILNEVAVILNIAWHANVRVEATKIGVVGKPPGDSVEQMRMHEVRWSLWFRDVGPVNPELANTESVKYDKASGFEEKSTVPNDANKEEGQTGRVLRVSQRSKPPLSLIWRALPYIICGAAIVLIVLLLISRKKVNAGR